MQTKSVLAGQRKGGHVESASEAGCWLKTVEVRGKPLQLGRTYHRRRTLRKMKTARKAMGNHPGKYVIRETLTNSAV